MNQNENRESSLIKINTINAVDNFDPMSLALEITDMNDSTKRYRLPVMTQMAWFRLKYPEGKIAVTVKPGKDYFLAEARVYVNYKDPADCYLAEGSATRGYLKDKPTVSPREWAQTAAIGIALRNAGFGLQCAVAGESYEDNTLNEFTGMNFQETPLTGSEETIPVNTNISGMAGSTEDKPVNQPQESAPTPEQTERTPLEKAKSMLCPISKYKDKTLGEMVRIDPKALSYVANNGTKYGSEIADGARLICEEALQQTSA